MPRKTGLSAAKKLEVVLRLLRREESASKLARRYGISEQSLYRYRDAFLDGGKQALEGGKLVSEGQQVRQLKQELADRDQVIGELTIANRILKKSADDLL